MDTFGCCSSYVECSDNLKCSHSSPEYDGCQYRHNLEAGKVFYGKNISLVSENLVSLEPMTKLGGKLKKELFLICYDRSFSVYRLDKNNLSYSLNADQVEVIEKIFSILAIPYSLEINENQIVIEGSDEDPSNSRVVFSIEELKFVILNSNSCLIRQKYAKGICESLKKRGLDSRLEMRGLNPKYSSVPPHPAQVTKPIENVQTIDEIKQIEPANINNMSEIVPKYSSNIINLYTQGLPIKSIVSSVFKARKAIDKETNAKHVQQEVELEILKYVTEVAV